MWAWDAKTLEILGFQDLIARAHLLDISPDGKYCAYYAEAHHKSEHYLAISRPPYFTALWIVDVFHLHIRAAVFDEDQVFRYFFGDADEADWHKRIPQADLSGSPYRFERATDFDEFEILTDLAAKRCSGAYDGGANDWQSHNLRTQGIYHDRMGRTITVRGHEIHANGRPFLDCQRQPFCSVETPEWAKLW